MATDLETKKEKEDGNIFLTLCGKRPANSGAGPNIPPLDPSPDPYRPTMHKGGCSTAATP